MFHAHNIFTKMLIFSYNNAQIHPNVTVQYLKKYPFCPTSMKSVRSYFGFLKKNQSSSQTKGFMHSSVQKILETCERVHPGV